MSEAKMQEEFESWSSSQIFPKSWKEDEAAWGGWQAACAHKDAEFAKEREQLRALIAMQAEALKEAVSLIDVDTEVAFPKESKLINAAISSSAESAAPQPDAAIRAKGN